MSEWNRSRLGDFVIHSKGFAFKSKDYQESGVPIIKVRNFTSDSIDLSDVDYLDQSRKQEYSKVELDYSDVVIATVGSWLTNPNSVVGKTIKVPKAAAGSLLNQNAVKLKSNDQIDQLFLYYLLKNDSFKYYIVGTAQGSANQASITLNDIFNYQFNLPPLPEQKAIAHILGRLDDKIELNRQMNQTLEAMAQALFKSWFVDFDPVLDNALAAGNEIPEALKAKAEKRLLKFPALKGGVPALGGRGGPLLRTNPELAKQFPNSFTYNETLGKWIPEGWEVKTVGELSTVISKGTTPRKGDLEGTQESIPFIKVRDIDDNGNLDHDLDLIPEEIHLKQLKRSILRQDDLLFSIAGTIGRVAIVPSRLNNSNCNQAVAFIRLIDKSQNNILVHQFLRSDYIQGEIHSKVVQAVQANTSLRNLSDLKITLAGNETLKAFNDSMSDFYNRIALNKQQTETLTQLRDTLLPQLISGKVRVPEGLMK